MDPRKFLRMAALGMDDEILKSDWPWMCTMCERCIYVCPMKIDILQLIYNVRGSRPRDERPKGILGSCDMALKNDSGSAMGASPEAFTFVGEENFIEMTPNRSNNCCCGGGGGYGVIHLWTLICLALGILGENEREYLQDDLKEVAVYGAEQGRINR